jgi:hypothetical protein
MATSKKGSIEVVVTPTDGQQATGAADDALQRAMMTQAARSVWLSDGMSEAQASEAASTVVAAMKGLAPRNELEGLLVTQMVSIHNMAMDCTRRAMLPGQTLEGRDLNLRHAAKLMGLFTRQLEALDKHRGKGQQKITVEHVNVHAGGQAIVGSTVNAPSGAANEPPSSPPALPDRSAESLPLIEGDLAGKPARKQKAQAR